MFWKVSGELWEAFNPQLPPSHCYFYGSVVCRWWKTLQVFKSLPYFVIIPFLSLGWVGRVVDIRAGLNLSQSIFCWFLREYCLIIWVWGLGEVWSNPQSETDGQSGIPLPLENWTPVFNNELKLPPSSRFRSSRYALNTHSAQINTHTHTRTFQMPLSPVGET